MPFPCYISLSLPLRTSPAFLIKLFKQAFRCSTTHLQAFPLQHPSVPKAPRLIAGGSWIVCGLFHLRAANLPVFQRLHHTTMQPDEARLTEATADVVIDLGSPEGDGTRTRKQQASL